MRKTPLPTSQKAKSFQALIFLPDGICIGIGHATGAVKSGREVEVDGSLLRLKYLSRY